jgi:quercetin dioxygenase-like cupin family protein
MPKTKKKAARKSTPARKVLKMTKASKRGPAKVSVQKGQLKHIPWTSVELENLNPLLQRQLVVGEDIMVARVLMKKGCIIPLHSHYNEQVTYILEGALKFWIDGKEIVVNAGEVLTIPRNMPHKAEALVDTVDLDVFNPPRADWINKADEYLRTEKEEHRDRLWKQG